ncbi:hypothetical protein JOQ06_029466 [Pogonophryne albipinna]|uniref:Uncharacterized protein n=1 Tax=Pogonophryne albipinna TaxID=1090488 RepID=A0AAD6FLT2_9TELE|nr:hypothetical protein JOQ06_029466 [Pogonophryne albipinna]
MKKKAIFPSYNHLMAFWFLIEPSIYKMVRVTRAISAAKRNEEVVTHARPSTRQLLQPIDEFFLFLCFLSVGLKEGPCKPLQCTPVHCEPHHCNMDEFSYNFIGVTVHLAYTCISSSPPPRGIQRFPRHTGDPGLHRAEVSNTILTPPPK